jgi:hypothetical protein
MKKVEVCNKPKIRVFIAPELSKDASCIGYLRKLQPIFDEVNLVYIVTYSFIVLYGRDLKKNRNVMKKN